MHQLPPRRAGFGLRPAVWLLAAFAAFPPAQAAEPGLLVGRVSRVHDGDSLSLQQGRQRVMIRLASIDAPEITQPHGKTARTALQACALGRLVTVTVRGNDRYGRSVGVIDSAGRDCALEQLRNGLAWHSTAHASQQTPGDNLAYSVAEREARRRRIGLWTDNKPVPPWVYRRQGEAIGPQGR